MSHQSVIEELEKEQMSKVIPNFNIGDTLKVSIKIIEGNKERIQAFTGTVIARKGSGLSESITLYRVAYGSAMERVFMLHSPRLESIELVRMGKVRKSKLYYIRGKMGKKAKIQEKILSKDMLAKLREKQGKKEALAPTKEEVKPEVNDAVPSQDQAEDTNQE